jgi:tRNA modification GTPase
LVIVFLSPLKTKIYSSKTHTLHLGHIVDDAKTLDEVLVSIFKVLIPTGENTIEISCHGSTYIQQQIIQLLLRRMPYGRSWWIYTKSFLNGNLICHRRKQWPIWSPPIMKPHQIAMQMRGFSMKSPNCERSY